LPLSLTPGARFGSYEILALLGMGGMGEVYRATDTTLHRDVALKVLPEVFALDPERVARFTREAQALAALNHPHIASIYGVEAASDVRALVLELVEGPTLADRLIEGALGVQEALVVARQIAEALESAHDQGIIHRDLKPANIKIRDDGTVKVLDFGLAKAFETPGDGGTGSTSLPTLTSPAATRLGTIMGTAAYMSPEQARGRRVDKRSDVWAFGCVLYEMLTGARAFDGEDVSETIARVIEREPDWRRLERTAPTAVVRLVRRCLQKDPRERLRDVGDARLDIHEALTTPESSTGASGPPEGARRLLRLGGAVAAGTVLGAIGMWLVFPSSRTGELADRIPAAGPRISTEINLPVDAPLALDSEAAAVGFDSTLLDVSPDGRTVVYVGVSGGESRLYARDLDNVEVRALAGTDDAIHPFFSPDGRAVGFLTNDKVKSYTFATGTTSTIADAATPVAATWTTEGDIVFAFDEGRRLARISDRGGAAEVVGDAREDFRYGRALPNGKQALVTQLGQGLSADYARIALLDLETQQVKTLGLSGYDARYVPPGRLVFGRSGTAFAVGFDLDSNEVVGTPVPIASSVRMHSLYPYSQLAISASGLLVYVPGGDVAVASVAWVDRQGQVEFLPIEPRVYGMFDLSRDGHRLAAQVADNKDYIFVYDIERRASRNVTVADGAGWPKWSPSGDRLAFTSFAPDKPYRLMVQQMNSDRPPVVVAESPTRMTPSTWSPDGRQLTFYEFPSNRLGVVSFGEDGSAAPPTYLSFTGSAHDISADTRWIVYGGSGINVRRLPPDEQVYKVSDDGTEPRWCPDCPELIYRTGNRWFSVDVGVGADFQWQPPRFLLQTEFNDSPGPSWAPSADGQRILVLKRQEERPRTRLEVVQGWLPDAPAVP